VLEHHPTAGPLPRDVALGQLVQLIAGAAVADQLAVQLDLPRVELPGG
jgi:hypothetical protein